MEAKMKSLILTAVDVVTSFMNDFGIISGIFLIILESMIPVLPLGVLIALNVMTFGSIIGFIISWLSTVIGCMLAFYICRRLKEKYEKKYNKDKNVTKIRKIIDNISLSNLVLIISLPFTPAFAVNIAAGLSNINPKKYLTALLIGKLQVVFFWGFIGKSFLESISDPYTIMQIVVLLIISYLISKIVNRFIGG